MIGRVNVRIDLVLTLEDLIDGLCSAHSRGSFVGEVFPDKLTRREIIREVRTEFRLHGSDNVPFWHHGLSRIDVRYYQKYARKVVLKAFPELEEKA